MREQDLPAADRIIRLAFGTFIGLPDPMQFMGDADYARTRFLADPSAALAAELDGQLVGSNFLTRWGSVGFFGPLTIRPDLWDRGIAQRLMGATMNMFEQWGIQHIGLFTFASSIKHVTLYQKFGFWPRFLTVLMARPVGAEPSSTIWSAFDQLNPAGKDLTLQACRTLTDSILGGLDVEREIRAADEQRLGDTVLIRHGSELAGLAVCHVGPRTEAGSGKCYIKFGAVRSGPDAAVEFRRLLEACRGFAVLRGASQLAAGVNLGRLEAYREMLQAGYQTTMQGVAMQLHGEPIYNRPEAFIIDDWR
jgi:GNAT superfamily N-acetyltransferase